MWIASWIENSKLIDCMFDVFFIFFFHFLEFLYWLMIYEEAHALLLFLHWEHANGWFGQLRLKNSLNRDIRFYIIKNRFRLTSEAVGSLRSVYVRLVFGVGSVFGVVWAISWALLNLFLGQFGLFLIIFWVHLGL